MESIGVKGVRCPYFRRCSFTLQVPQYLKELLFIRPLLPEGWWQIFTIFYVWTHTTPVPPPFTSFSLNTSTGETLSSSRSLVKSDTVRILSLPPILSLHTSLDPWIYWLKRVIRLSGPWDPKTHNKKEGRLLVEQVGGQRCVILVVVVSGTHLSLRHRRESGIREGV